MQKIVLTLLFIASLIGCRSISNTGSSSFSDSDSPYVKEEPVVKKESKIVVKKEKVKVLESEDKAFKYYVIIGSFKVLDNARNYKNALTGEGFTPVILENENGLYRVSVAAYNDENASREKVNSIRVNYQKYNDTWLLIRTL